MPPGGNFVKVVAATLDDSAGAGAYVLAASFGREVRPSAQRSGPRHELAEPDPPVGADPATARAA